MGKSIAVLFVGAALMIVAASLASPGTVAASKSGCTPAYGIDPCATAAIN